MYTEKDRQYIYTWRKKNLEKFREYDKLYKRKINAEKKLKKTNLFLILPNYIPPNEV